jgi:hypothetical protein
MTLADNLLRKLDLLESALALKKSGIPSKVTTLCYSGEEADIKRAERQKMDFYGIRDREVLTTAGVDLDVLKMPWLSGRGVGITSTEDPRISQYMRQQVISHYNGKSVPPVVGTKQDTDGFKKPESEE